ncbi:ferric-chelate reductase 1 [Sarcophilus harrisii]|uniref:Ferric-chelate reductase 1 n=1 Tax=Sarcophilus harrisii TaxID=9305 RepID=G3WM82_SARHA|nr:ferric-chelate reductase 1 [Sarcophilus harrisii]XP_031822997.1 ferric-chelate reductase 1 [Sarcophilus harrisii]XP_031822998.1 ferric-chelate reductase 1 [Sarcophilus harrisii]
MMVPEFTLGIWILLQLISPVANYANGKVMEACHTMVPGHGYPPQSDPVHKITLNQTTFLPGDTVTVTLSGPRFKGFLIEARNAEDLKSSSIGSFTLFDEEECQLLTCDHKEGSAVSHTSPSKKTQIEVYWNAPDTANHSIQFLATVVEKYKIYWVKILSPVLFPLNAHPFTMSQTTKVSSPTSSPITNLKKSFSALDCGEKKFCIRNPVNCDPENEYHCFFLSFERKNHSVLIEMSGPNEGYLSFALSHDQWMGDDDGYICIHEDETVHIHPSYVVGRSHPVLESSATLEAMAWRLTDGVIQCSFRRNISLPGSKRFDLDQKYYIFLANGATNNGQIYKHSEHPLITSEKHDVTDHPKNIGGSRSPLLLKFHGALMFVAWMTTGSIGVLVARFFKPVWSKAFFFGEAAWFQIHRFLMLCTSGLTTVGFVLPFIYRKGWSKEAGYHPYLGCVVMMLAVLQLLLAVFRPPSHDPRRPIFNWTHWGTGTATRILAVAAIFLGMDLPGLNLPSPVKTYAMIGFVAWHVGTEILLEIHAYRLTRKVEILEDDRIQILQSFTTAEAEGHAFKKVVLVIYFCGNVAFLFIFLTAIGQQ